MKKKYDGEKITLKLPKGMKSSELKWLSVWCKEFKVDFASIKFKTVDTDTTKYRNASDYVLRLSLEINSKFRNF